MKSHSWLDSCIIGWKCVVGRWVLLSKRTFSITLLILYCLIYFSAGATRERHGTG